MTMNLVSGLKQKSKACAIAIGLMLPLWTHANSYVDELFDEERIGKVIQEKASSYGLDPRVLYTLASIESNFNPLAIAVETSYASAMKLKSLRSPSIKVQVGRTYHSRIWLVSLFPKDYDTAVFIIHQLEKMNFGFDVGLMQINTINFGLKEVKRMFCPENNIEKAAKHLSGCKKQFKQKVHQIECYNRGAGNLRKMLRKNKHYYPYYTRFERHWKKYF